MDIDSVMSAITSGLTGNPEADLKHLVQAMEAYKQHPQATEILRACGRLMYSLMPEEGRQQFNQAARDDRKLIEEKLNNIRRAAHEKDYLRALGMAEDMAHDAEAMGMYKDDAVSAYFTFDEPFEKALCYNLLKPEKQMRDAQFPYAQMYALQGSVLFDLQRFEEAKAALEKARRWNPVSAAYAFEHAETCKMLGRMDAFFSLTIDAMRFCFTPEHLARAYRNLGYYFIEMRRFEVSATCLYLSLMFEGDSPVAHNELQYIAQKTGRLPPQPAPEQARTIAQQHGFPFGPARDVIGLALALSQQAQEEQALQAAAYYLGIAYRLTGDEGLSRQLAKFEGGLN